MGKISVFKFNINNANNTQYNNNNYVANIIYSYLNSRGLLYNNERNCFCDAQPTKKDEARTVAANIGIGLVGALFGTMVIPVTTLFQHGFEFQIVGNELIIKAYTINYKHNVRYAIHNTFNSNQSSITYYNDLRYNLFRALEQNGIMLVSKETEKVTDVGEKHPEIVILIIFGAFMAFILLMALTQ